MWHCVSARKKCRTSITLQRAVGKCFVSWWIMCATCSSTTPWNKVPKILRILLDFYSTKHSIIADNRCQLKSIRPLLSPNYTTFEKVLNGTRIFRHKLTRFGGRLEVVCGNRINKLANCCSDIARVEWKRLELDAPWVNKTQLTPPPPGGACIWCS